MKLDTRNRAQRELCRNVVVTLDGRRQHHCVVADSAKGYIEIAVGERHVGMARKPVLRRMYGAVLITLDGRPI